MSKLTNAWDSLDKFLKENPHMKEYQKEIDEVLARTPEENRTEAVFLLLGGKLNELNATYNKLSRLLKEGQDD